MATDEQNISTDSKNQEQEQFPTNMDVSLRSESFKYDSALDTMYQMFYEEGYNGTVGSLFTLLCTNPEALKTGHEMFTEEGYTGSIEDLSLLLGTSEKQPVKKKKIRI